MGIEEEQLRCNYSSRPYRAAWSEEITLVHIRSLEGTHFDPQIVNICLELDLLQNHIKEL